MDEPAPFRGVLVPPQEMYLKKVELLQCQKRVERPLPCEASTSWGALTETFVGGLLIGALAMALHK